MGRNLFDFKVATSSSKFLSGKAADASLSSTRSTASSSADSSVYPPSAASTMEGHPHRSRTADHSGRADRKPTLTFTSSITGTNTTTILGSSTGHNSEHGHQNGSHGTAPANSEQKASKKCSVCGKSFNPLRRRHYCRTCTAVVCSSCSISRKVESTFEGAITVRMCVSCKLSSIASQDDFYDRIFSQNGGAGHAPGSAAGSDSQPSTSDNGSGVVTDRLSFASYGSTTSSHVKDDASASSMTSNTVDSHTPLDKRAASASNLPLRRKSSTTTTSSSSATTDAATSSRGNRRGSFTAPSAPTAGPSEDCPWCMNEACAPLHEYFEVPYPFFLELADPSAKNQYIAAKHLDNEKERLRSVRALRSALKAGTSAAQTITQLCSMAAIATQSPMALVGLLDKHVYVPCAEMGLGSLDKIDRQKSLAAHACRNGSPLVCSDLARDVRFAANPWRRDVLKAQFYAGIPLTLSNGHTIGAIEVFDVAPRFACMNVIAQLQTVVRGLLRKFEEILAKNPPPGEELDAAPVVLPAHSSVSSGRRAAPSDSSSSESKHRAPSRAPAPSAPAPPAIPPPKKSPKPSRATQSPKPAGPAPTPPKPATPTVQKPPTMPAAQPPAAPAVQPPTAPAATPAAAAPAATPAAPTTTPAEPKQDEMEKQLMLLLSQTTSTQEQLRDRQGLMVNALSSHSQQISELAKQLERMESTLASKLGGDLPEDGETEGEATPAAAVADAASA